MEHPRWAWQPDIIGLSEFRGTPASQQLADAGFAHQLTSINADKLTQNALLLAADIRCKQQRIAHADTPRTVASRPR